MRGAGDGRASRSSGFPASPPAPRKALNALGIRIPGTPYLILDPHLCISPRPGRRISPLFGVKIIIAERRGGEVKPAGRAWKRKNVEAWERAGGRRLRPQHGPVLPFALFVNFVVTIDPEQSEEQDFSHILHHEGHEDAKVGGSQSAVTGGRTGAGVKLSVSGKSEAGSLLRQLSPVRHSSTAEGRTEYAA